VPGEIEGDGVADPPTSPAPLRILLAHDLSPGSELATSLIAATPWPTGTSVRVVTSPAGIGPPLSSFANLREIRDHANEVRRTIANAHTDIAASLAAVGLRPESRIVHGRAGRAILVEAERHDTDLIVVGASGQGSLAAAILGSVSRAVVDDASRPVLVARGSSIARILVATDGSAASRSAMSVVAGWPALATAQLLVVAVGEGPPRYPRSVLDPDAWRSAFRASIDAATARACDHVEAAVTELGASAGETDVEIRLGDAAAEIGAAAREWEADLVVLGAEDRPLLERLLGSSVPRRVIDGVDASVLVVRSRTDRADAP
jgi:nucleotide-binding universal stress UspA family protein